MDFSIIIPTHARHESLLNCLDSCLSLEWGDFICEILIVSDGADGVLRRWLEPYLLKYPFLTYYECVDKGVNCARNLGMKYARGEFFYFIDDDCALIERKQLQSIHREFLAKPSLAAVGGPYLSPPQAAFTTRYYNAMTNWWLAMHQGSEGYNTRLLGGNICFRSEIFASNLIFCPEIRYGAAETELLARLEKKGMRLCCYENLAIEHRADLNWSEVIRKSWQQNAHRAMLDTKHTNTPSISRIWRICYARPQFAIWLCLVWPYFFLGRVAYWLTKWESWLNILFWQRSSPLLLLRKRS